MVENIFISAFLMGLLGSTHCVAMCSGIVGVLSQKASNPVPAFSGKIVGVVLTYNAGRIGSYCCIGVLAGFVGEFGFGFLDSETTLFYSRLLTSIFMASFAVYLMGWPSFLPYLEKKGQSIWRLISPLTRKLIPIRSLPQSFLLGLIWGWLPCGLVYSAVALSLSTTKAAYGAITMLSFGLGTLPALLLMGLASQKLTHLKKSTKIRQIAAAIVFVLAIMHLFSIGILPHSTHAGH